MLAVCGYKKEILKETPHKLLESRLLDGLVTED